MKFMFPLFSPDDVVEAPPEEELSDLEILEPDDAKEDEETEDTETDESDDREGDSKEEKRAEGADEDTLIRVSYSDVKKEFPEFFKRFPQLKTAFFREQEFTKRFANLEDADEAIEAIESFRAVEDTVKDR